jgi:hypothetical protein
MPHTATGSCLGVLSETLMGLNLSATTHTDVGSYPNDPWTFMDTTGNYNDDSGMVSSSIGSGNITGGVTYAIDPKPVPGVDLNGAGAIAVAGSTDVTGSYSLTNFGSGAYTVTPSKAAQLCGTSNGIFANDAGLIAQYVVGLIALSPVQVAAAKVSGPSTPALSSFDAGLIAQKVVGNCAAMNLAGQWIFTPSSNDYAAVTAGLVDNYTAYMLGDVNGDWNPAAVAHRTRFASADDKNAVHASLASAVAAPGAEVSVPLRVDNLSGRSVGSYQFDIEYDPAVIRPSQVAASISGTISQGMGIAFNSPQAGLLKVAVYGAVPVNGDGVYVDLRFTVVGGAGSSTALTIADFRLNDGTDAISVAAGSITVARPVDDSYVIGRLTTRDGKPFANSVVSFKGTSGRIRSSN